MNPSSSEPQAYGAGRAGERFDLIEFIKRPQVILRILAFVCRSFFSWGFFRNLIGCRSLQSLSLHRLLRKAM